MFYFSNTLYFLPQLIMKKKKKKKNYLCTYFRNFQHFHCVTSSLKLGKRRHNEKSERELALTANRHKKTKTTTAILRCVVMCLYGFAVAVVYMLAHEYVWVRKAIHTTTMKPLCYYAEYARAYYNIASLKLKVKVLFFLFL